jgi:hypothetical protein
MDNLTPKKGGSANSTPTLQVIFNTPRITKHISVVYFPPRPRLLVERVGVALRLLLEELDRLGVARLLLLERLGLTLRVLERLGETLRLEERLGVAERVEEERLGV